MNGENLFVNELVVILNSDHCHKKVKEISISII